MTPDPLPARVEIDDIDGGTMAARRNSLTTRTGAARQELIDGVSVRLTRPVTHHHGHLTEVLRTDWGVLDAPIVQVNLTLTFPGRVRAWGLHQETTDRLFASSGLLCIVCFDARASSPTRGRVNEFLLGARSQGLVVIPPGVYHGWKNVGDDEAGIVSMPSQLYDYDAPDRWDLLWDSPEAEALIPYQWT